MDNMEMMVKELAECLHAQWYASWYEAHGGHFAGGTDVCDVMPPVPAIVVAIAAKLLVMFPPEGDDIDNGREYAVDLGFTATGSGGASGYTDMSRVRGYALEQVEYFDIGVPDWAVGLGWLNDTFAAVAGDNQPAVTEAGDGVEWARDAFTPHDMNHLRETLDRRLADGKRDPEDDDYDDGEGYEDVMTSRGYVGVCWDGEILAGGRVVLTLDV